MDMRARRICSLAQAATANLKLFPAPFASILIDFSFDFSLFYCCFPFVSSFCRSVFFIS